MVLSSQLVCQLLKNICQKVLENQWTLFTSQLNNACLHAMSNLSLNILVFLSMSRDHNAVRTLNVRLLRELQVSGTNHGGRQIDGGPAAFDSLQEVAEAVDKRVPIVFDSGVRRGQHVFKALASGADLVAIGRPSIYGLAPVVVLVCVKSSST